MTPPAGHRVPAVTVYRLATGYQPPATSYQLLLPDFDVPGARGQRVDVPEHRRSALDRQFDFTQKLVVGRDERCRIAQSGAGRFRRRPRRDDLHRAVEVEVVRQPLPGDYAGDEGDHGCGSDPPRGWGAVE